MAMRTWALSYLFLSVLSFATVSYGQTRNSFYRNVPAGAEVEGSVRFNGIQPNYIIDVDSPALQPLWDRAEEFKADTQTPFLEKMDLMIKEVRNVFLNHHEYQDPTYLALLKEFRDQGKPIPLSQFYTCGAGVCRENALLLHLFLKRAGVPNLHIYAKVRVDNNGMIKPGEDHGFVIFKYKKEWWIADSYSNQFNGYSFNEFLESKGKVVLPKNKLPFAADKPDRRGILRLNKYPHILRKNSCSAILM